MLLLETGLVVVYGLCLVFMLGFSLTQWQLTRLARRPPTPAARPH